MLICARRQRPGSHCATVQLSPNTPLMELKCLTRQRSTCTHCNAWSMAMALTTVHLRRLVSAIADATLDGRRSVAIRRAAGEAAPGSRQETNECRAVAMSNQHSTIGVCLRAGCYVCVVMALAMVLVDVFAHVLHDFVEQCSSALPHKFLHGTEPIARARGNAVHAQRFGELAARSRCVPFGARAPLARPGLSVYMPQVKST